MTSLLLLVSWLVNGADKVPAPEDVKAGWIAFAVFVGLIVAVALLGFSMNRHLRKAGANADQGAFDPSKPQRPHAS